MDFCYGISGNYGVAIILFTFVSKILLLPVSIWTYYNSIKMIKIQPDINMLKVQYYGQRDIIAEKEAELQKEAGYHPLLSTIPLIIQLVLLMGVVEVIKLGIANPDIDMSFLGTNLGLVPKDEGLRLLWVPLIAGVSSYLLCIAQNKSNVLQSEQSAANKVGTMLFSVGLSVYLGWFVFLGTVSYWIWSNLFAILQLYILNAIIRPRRFVDYEKLEKSRKELASIQSTGKKKGEGFFSTNARREREDYKRFFSVVNKHLVFYSESNGFYKYFKGYIEYLLKNTNITIHYITSDPDDMIFEKAKNEPKLRAYYIGENKLITLMMKMESDIVVMTMPDLETYHIKRSYIKKDIEYIYVPHGVGSNNLTMRKGSMDHFDTIFCVGPHQRDEVVETEKLYGLPSKKCVEVGYPLVDEIRANYKASIQKTNDKPMILIAPSWQKDNIVDSCLNDILDGLQGKGYRIIVRPHPQEVRMKQALMDSLKSKYADCEDIDIQTDFSSNNPIMEADLLITDWSGICWEYAFTTNRPVLFIDTPMKVMNPEYDKIPVVPLNILLRTEIGETLALGKIGDINDSVKRLLLNTATYNDKINRLASEFIYNLDSSDEIGANYIIESLRDKIKRKKEQK
ncbi:MAG: YidC/Oxa1 family membrane protein insertase [Saccharofermentans sp.]|nr:YidC/Oxa1 family membrane protein insertase [Saccharofermentans sp.]